MRQVLRRSLLLSCLLTLPAAIAGVPARAAAAPTPLPAWQALEFEQQAFLVTARSQLTLTADSEDDQLWLLRADSSVASNSEEVVLQLAAADGRALHRSRLSQGKGRRFKSYDFTPEYILRERRDPPADTTLPPAEWPISSSKKIAYPPLPGTSVVTDGYALLELAGRFQHDDATMLEVVINTEFNFYLVSMTHGDGEAIKVDYRVNGADQPTTGKRPTRAVRLQVSPLGKPTDKPDFSLLGLEGDITLLFDAASGLPLQLRGTAPRIGRTEINLKAVTLREPAA